MLLGRLTETGHNGYGRYCYVSISNLCPIIVKKQELTCLRENLSIAE